jgi:hypothetical protein
LTTECEPFCVVVVASRAEFEDLPSSLLVVAFERRVQRRGCCDGVLDDLRCPVDVGDAEAERDGQEFALVGIEVGLLTDRFLFGVVTACTACSVGSGRTIATIE